MNVNAHPINRIQAERIYTIRASSDVIRYATIVVDMSKKTASTSQKRKYRIELDKLLAYSTTAVFDQIYEFVST
ncbi:MAG: hypothetical protein JRN20_20120 [Nitrososphaerota archaeon]|nr:hypothetical protein [Nitrososphaerota archaeon]